MLPGWIDCGMLRWLWLTPTGCHPNKSLRKWIELLGQNHIKLVQLIFPHCRLFAKGQEGHHPSCLRSFLFPFWNVSRPSWRCEVSIAVQWQKSPTEGSRLSVHLLSFQRKTIRWRVFFCSRGKETGCGSWRRCQGVKLNAWLKEHHGRIPT